MQQQSNILELASIAEILQSLLMFAESLLILVYNSMFEKLTKRQEYSFLEGSS